MRLPFALLLAPLLIAPATAQVGPEACVGDCDRNGVVAIDELVTLVRLALEAPAGGANGAAAPTADVCAAGDRDGNGAIGVDEVIAAVGSALRGCPPTPPPTATPTAITTGTFTTTTTPTETPIATPSGTPAPTHSASPTPIGPLPGEFQVNGNGAGAQAYPAIAGDPATGFLVAWESYGNGIFAQRYDTAGARAGSEFQVNTGTAGGKEVCAAADATGTFIVVWQRANPTQAANDIFAQRFDSLGARVGTEFQVNTDGFYNRAYPSVAAALSGDFVVAWQGYKGGYDVFAQRFDAGADKVGAEFRVNTHSVEDAEKPDVAVDAQGNFVVVWQGGVSARTPDILAQRYDSSGSATGDEFRVNSFTTGFDPSVAAGPDGSLFFVWQRVVPDSSARTDIRGQRYASSGDRLGEEFQVSSATAEFARDPAITTDSTGGTLVAWSSYGDQGSFNVRARRFDPSAAAVGEQFQVNVFTGGVGYPAVAASAADHFVVVWESYGQDGDTYGIFGRRFGAADLP